MSLIISKWIKKSALNAFNHWSSTYDENVTPKLLRRGYSYELLAGEIIQYLAPDHGATVLELGTGTGILGKEVKKLRPDLKLIGLDISNGMLKFANSTGAYDMLIQADSENVPLRDNQVVSIYSAFMLHSLPNKEKFFSGLEKTMKFSGKFALVDLYRSKQRNPLSKFFDNVHSLIYEHGALSSYQTVQELIDILQRRNIQVLKNKRLDSSDLIVKNSKGMMTHHFLGCVNNTFNVV